MYYLVEFKSLGEYKVKDDIKDIHHIINEYDDATMVYNDGEHKGFLKKYNATIVISGDDECILEVESFLSHSRTKVIEAKEVTQAQYCFNTEDIYNEFTIESMNNALNAQLKNKRKQITLYGDIDWTFEKAEVFGKINDEKDRKFHYGLEGTISGDVATVIEMKKKIKEFKVEMEKEEISFS